MPDRSTSTAASGLTSADTEGAAVGLPGALAAGGILTDTRGQKWQTLILRSYVAATGRTCHAVRFTSIGAAAGAVDRIVCEQAGGWVLVPPLRQEPGGPVLTPDMRLSDRSGSLPEAGPVAG